MSIPKKWSPTLDSIGNQAHESQVYPNVMFLCQTVEGSESIPKRSITLAEDRSIFMPIINWISILDVDGDTDEELYTVAKEKIDEVANIEFSINGATVDGDPRELRVSSPPFDAMLPDGNIFSLPSGQRRFLSDGYWIFLRPNSNLNSLTSFGSCSSGITRIGVKYNISII